MSHFTFLCPSFPFCRALGLDHMISRVQFSSHIPFPSFMQICPHLCAGRHCSFSPLKDQFQWGQLHEPFPIPVPIWGALCLLLRVLSICFLLFYVVSPSICPSMHPFIHPSSHLSLHSFNHAPIHSPTDPPTHLLTHPSYKCLLSTCCFGHSSRIRDATVNKTSLHLHGVCCPARHLD